MITRKKLARSHRNFHHLKYNEQAHLQKVGAAQDTGHPPLSSLYCFRIVSVCCGRVTVCVGVLQRLVGSKVLSFYQRLIGLVWKVLLPKGPSCQPSNLIFFYLLRQSV